VFDVQLGDETSGVAKDMKLANQSGQTMRQEVQIQSQPWSERALACFVALVLASAVTGCQLTRPPQSTGAPAKTTYKPQETQPATRATVPIAASAHIRGQSGVVGTPEDTANNKNRYSQGSPVASSPVTISGPTGASLVANQELPIPNIPSYPAAPPVASGTTYGSGAQYGIPPSYDYNAPSTLELPAPSSPVGDYGYGAQQGAGYGQSPISASQGYGAVGGYDSTILPGVSQPLGTRESAIAPGVYSDPDPLGSLNSPDFPVPGYQPLDRITPLDVYVQEGRTGSITVGGSVNSDLGVAGQVVIQERNFDIRRFPRNWGDMWSGRAFRGDGQNFRAELMPGNRVERYTVSWATPNLLGYLPYSLSVGGFYYTRQFRDWTEQRLGGRVALGYNVTQDMSISSELRMEDVTIFDPRVRGVTDLESALGSNDLYTARVRLAHDTRDSPFMSTEGALFEMVYDQVFGEYDYPRGQINYSRYFLLRERPDGSGRHTIASTWKVGITGAQTPIFENYYAGGYSTMRGFSFRGASPVDGGVQVGGELSLLGSLEYVFPLTADEMLRGIAFVDYGTVERDLEINSENFRVAPGLGLRVTVPALGQAPLAFDFAFPINYADTDDRQIFSFFMGFTRS
jgi:outer membrane protein insertion porin family